jgi:hypothetical protein
MLVALDALRLRSQSTTLLSADKQCVSDWGRHGAFGYRAIHGTCPTCSRSVRNTAKKINHAVAGVVTIDKALAIGIANTQATKLAVDA